MLALRPVDKIIDFLTSFPSPEEVLAFRPPTESQERLSLLLYEQKARKLTKEEDQELDYFMMVEHLMRMAKLKARKRVGR
ncbi:MAG: hypothetical protein AAFN92_07770 [Bacteroidota bacterium]